MVGMMEMGSNSGSSELEIHVLICSILMETTLIRVGTSIRLILEIMIIIETLVPLHNLMSAFSELKPLANSIYMNTEVSDVDLYVTMHTGVWIMLYPWGKWPEQPSDWELFHQIRDDVHANISDIPIQNANQGLYPNCECRLWIWCYGIPYIYL